MICSDKRGFRIRRVRISKVPLYTVMVEFHQSSFFVHNAIKICLHLCCYCHGYQIQHKDITYSVLQSLSFHLLIYLNSHYREWSVFHFRPLPMNRVNQPESASFTVCFCLQYFRKIPFFFQILYCVFIFEFLTFAIVVSTSIFYHR